AALTIAACQTAGAGDYGKTVINDKAPIADKSWCDLFKNNTLYEGDGFVRKVKFKGRYHGQWISQTEDTLAGTNGYHEYDHRRFRLGTEISFAHDLKLTASINIADGTGGRGAHGLTNGPFFDDWDEFNLEWAPSKDFYVLVGKAKQKITMENETSSNNILTIERSAITNSVISNKPWGIAVGFNVLGLDHEIGAWVVGADRDSTGDRYDWADFRSRGSLTYRTSYDITEATEVHFDYQFTNNSDGRVNPRGRADESLGSSFEHVVALGTKSEFGQLGLITDLIYAGNGLAGGGLPAGYDTWGLVIMPYYNITDKLQLVTRYAYMGEGREQRPQRYDLRQTVEDYHTFYAGLNYYICGNNLKVMAGYEYATGDIFGTPNRDVNTGTWMLGLRTSW
ncbi:MAG TPA: porin, partial [Bacteroidia bacterium]|nr:porin [Bacteroidia bacterium]